MSEYRLHCFAPGNACDWIVGDTICTADQSCCGCMFYPEGCDLDWDQFPHLSAWGDRITAPPGWQRPHDLLPCHPLETPA